MLKFKLHTILVCFLFASSGYPASKTDQALCRILVAQKQKSSFFKEVYLGMSFVNLVRSPESFIRPEKLKISAENILTPSNTRSDEFVETETKNLKNYVISLGPIYNEYYDYAKAHPEDSAHDKFQKISAELNSEKDKLKKIIDQSDDIPSCLQAIQDNQYSDERRQALELEIKKYPIMSQLEQTELLQNSIERLSTRLRLSLEWTYVRAASVDEVLDIIRSPTTANVLIVSHGGMGSLFDSYFDLYPNNTFKTVSPSLFSISFYSCNSSETVNNYQLKTYFAQAPSAYPNRFVFSVAPIEGNYFLERVLGQTETKNEEGSKKAPLFAADSFLIQIDSVIKKHMSKTILLPKADYIFGAYSKTCRLMVSGYKLNHSRVAVSLNQNLLGVINGDEFQSKRLFEFPCEWQNETGENTLHLGSISTQTSGIPPSQFDAETLVLERTSMESIQIRSFHDRNGNWKSSIMTLSPAVEQ